MPIHTIVKDSEVMVQYNSSALFFNYFLPKLQKTCCILDIIRFIISFYWRRAGLTKGKIKDDKKTPTECWFLTSKIENINFFFFSFSRGGKMSPTLLMLWVMPDFSEKDFCIYPQQMKPVRRHDVWVGRDKNENFLESNDQNHHKNRAKIWQGSLKMSVLK